MTLKASSFIKACFGENEGPIPIWIMRQAGRYLPEYLKVRERASFKELCASPELIVEVVKQPIVRFDLDAAILFSDILTILDPMGARVEFPDGGPVLEKPIASADDVQRLHPFDFDRELPFVFEAIRQIKASLPGKPLIGFAGSPFTIASYLIEGKGSKNFDKAKQFLHKYPSAAETLIGLITDITADYLNRQIAAGADAVQLFQSWDGVLAPEEYVKYALEPANAIFNQIAYDVPRILFVNNLAPYADLVNEINCEVVGVDYRMDIRKAEKMLPGKALQGNLDPAALYASPGVIQEKVTRLLESLEHPNRFIFNLGHGITPQTPIESVEILVKTVKNFR